MSLPFRTVFLTALLAVGADFTVVADSASAPARRVEFDRDIRPLLSDTCYTCHGPDAAHRKADLRLDTRDGAFADLGGYHAVVPGKPEKSALFQRIATHDSSERMPPPDAGRQLSESDIELVRRWIAEGAEWTRHWSLVPPKRPSLPRVRSLDQVKNPIDVFVLRELEARGLEFSPEASREKLMRRVTFDLTGLPPTLAELDAFLEDRSPGAYERHVDRLLHSPRFGEHLLPEWLDASRYADTNGYQSDSDRTMWPWRDWVLDAFNANIPFDQFTIEQLAGDMLPNPTLSQRIATGFNRNHMLNGEGGRIAEESRVEYVVDRVDTTSTVWLGLTLGCARCHEHKYDPVTQEEFYGVYALFNNITETGESGDARTGAAKPMLPLPGPEEEPRYLELKKRVAELDAKRQAIRLRINGNLKQEREREQAVLAAYEAIPERYPWEVLFSFGHKADDGAELTALADGSVFAEGESSKDATYDFISRLRYRKVALLRLEILPYPSRPGGGSGRDGDGSFALSEVEFYTQLGKLDTKEMTRLEVTGAKTAQGPASALTDGDAETVWTPADPHSSKQTILFRVKKPFAASLDLMLRVVLKHRGAPLGRFRISVSEDSGASFEHGTAPHRKTLAALRKNPRDRSEDENERILNELLRGDSGWLGLTPTYDVVKKEFDTFTRSLLRVMVMKEREEPRDTFVLIRGQYDKYGATVTSGIPASLEPKTTAAPRDRLAFARWLVSPQSPLTARVTVNRYWQRFFGLGLVRTTEDFGTQGERPSHPELLDWLASEFRQGWDVKTLFRLIVTSATYRQSSRTTPELGSLDPENRLYSRGPRLRLPVFSIRDQALFLSGLLVNRIGGPPVKPYQPPGLWAEYSFGKKKYLEDEGEGLYRRSVYTFWNRSVGPPNMFDSSPRQVCAVRPRLTNTPLHSLTLLNDVTYVEAARAYAERMFREGGDTVSSRLSWAFLLATSRPATENERRLLIQSFDEALSSFKKNPSAADELIAVGDSEARSELDPVELAAYAATANVILNLDEVISKD